MAIYIYPKESTMYISLPSSCTFMPFITIISHDKWKEPKPSVIAYLSFSLIISCRQETDTTRK